MSHNGSRVCQCGKKSHGEFTKWQRRVLEQTVLLQRALSAATLQRRLHLLGV